MVPFPKKVVEAGLLKPAMKAINDLRDYVQTLTPRPGKGIKINHTNTGAVFDVDSIRGLDGADGVVQWKGEYQYGVDYITGDIVCRGASETDAISNEKILKNGGLAGVYIALRNVPAVNVNLDPDFLRTFPHYAREPSQPPVRNADGPAPAEPNPYWQTLARFATPFTTFRQTVGPPVDWIDGQSSPSYKLSPYITLDASWITSTTNPGKVEINVTDIPNSLLVKFREVEVCVGGQTKKMICLCSVPY